MVVTNNDFCTQYGYGGMILAALTVMDENLIYIHASHMRSITIGHELGHFLDCIAGWPSQTSEFQQLFWQESGSFVEHDSRGDQSKQNTHEFFAAICCQTYIAPDTEATAPQSFAFVKQYLPQ